MNLHAVARFGESCKDKKLTSVLLSNPATIAWLTGYAPPIQTGPNPFEGGPALGWWRDGQLTLVLSDAEAPAARSQGVEVCEYASYTIEGPAAGFQNQAAALRQLLSGSAADTSRVGVELNFVPASCYESLRATMPAADLVTVDGEFDSLRAVKSPEEIVRIQAALALCDLAQTETRQLMQAGMTEIELWTAVKTRLEMQAGCRLPVLADFIAGARTAEIGGLPGSYVLRAGDPVIADIVPRLNGYWGDNCGTHFVGEPSRRFRDAYRFVLGALRDASEAVRPGMRACDLDARLRKTMEGGGYPVYPHHSGHGLGTTYHEEPRIVAYNQATLQPGMIIALEPGVYIPDVGGIRLEDVLLVTEGGSEVLTRHLVAS